VVGGGATTSELQNCSVFDKLYIKSKLFPSSIWIQPQKLTKIHTQFQIYKDRTQVKAYLGSVPFLDWIGFNSFLFLLPFDDFDSFVVTGNCRCSTLKASVPMNLHFWISCVLLQTCKMRFVVSTSSVEWVWFTNFEWLCVCESCWFLRKNRRRNSVVKMMMMICENDWFGDVKIVVDDDGGLWWVCDEFGRLWRLLWWLWRLLWWLWRLKVVVEGCWRS